MGWWMIVACLGGAPQNGPLFSGCQDADCEIQRAMDAWDQRQADVLAAIQAHPAPEARIAIATALLAAHPGETAVLCPVMPPGDAQQRCQQMSERPHLWQEVRPAAPVAARPGGGPSSNEVAPVQPIQSTLTNQSPASHACASAADVHGCIVQAAQAEARQLRTQAAAGLCVNITESRWRGECFFQAAEAALQGRGAHGYGDAVELCAAAAPFAQNCHSHVLMLLAEQAPPADSPDPTAWNAIIQNANAVHTAWSWRDDYMAEVAVDRLWSEAVGRAYAKANTINGNPLDALPQGAHRHIRAAVVRALLDRTPARSHDLNGWIQQANMALRRRDTAHPPRGQRQTPFRSAPELWPTDLPGEEHFPATAYLGTARRTHTSDNDVDLAICILEAVGRTPPVHDVLMQEGMRHPDEQVRWTAKRLTELRAPPAH